MLQKMADTIKKDGANIFDLVLIQDGKTEAVTLHRVSACQNCYSVTKSFTATMVGIARDEGLLELDTPILHYLRDELPPEHDGKLSRVTIRHLLTHTMGNDTGYLFEADRFSHPDNWLRLVLGSPLAHEPGEVFVYSNSTYYLLSCILHRATGRPLEAYTKEKLFQPLGIRNYAWSSCPMGETSGATGLYLSTADMAKLGVLYLNGGVYQGRRIVSDRWVEEAVRPHVNLNTARTYGLGFWQIGQGYEANGRDSQVVLVRPGRNLVLAAHGYETDYDYSKLVD